MLTLVFFCISIWMPVYLLILCVRGLARACELALEGLVASACTGWATSLAIDSHLMVTLNPPSPCRCLSFPTSLIKKLRHILYVLGASPDVKSLWLPRRL